MDIAQLGIRIQQQGAEEAAAKLDALTASGARAETQLTGAAAKIANAVTAQSNAIRQSADTSARSVQIIETQLNTLAQVTANLTAEDKIAADVARGLAQALREQATAGNLSTLQMQKLATAEGALRRVADAVLSGASQTAAAAVEEQTALYQQRAIVLQHMAALELDATNGQKVHGLQLARLNQELGTFIGRLTGSNTAVTRLTAQVGGAVVGYGSMIAVLGGVALAIEGVKLVYDKLTEESRRAREEQEKLLKTFDDIAARAKTTEAATTQASIGAKQAQLAQLESQLQAQQAAAHTPVGGYTGAGVASGATNPFGDAGAAEAAKIKQTQADIALVESQLTDLVRKSAEDRDRIITGDLANLVKSGEATARQVETAKQLLAGYEHSLTALQRAGSSDTAVLVDLVDKIKQLNDALYPKQHVTTAPSAVTPGNDIIAALVKQGDELRKVAHEDNAQALAAQQAAAAVGLQGEALTIFNAHARAAQETLAAYATLAGPALTLRLEDIRATEDQAVTTARHTQAIKDSVDQLKANAEMMKQVTAIGQHNIEITRVSTAEYEKLGAALSRDVFAGFDHFIRQGHLSFQSLAEEGGSVALKMLGTFEQGAARIRADMAKAIAEGNQEQARADQAELERIAQQQAAVSKLAAAFAAAQIGYSFGQQSPNVASGTVGGAVSGAATGAQLAGPAGAVIGGMVGAVTGLLGAAEAHKEAAQQLKDAAKQIEQGLAAYGASNSVQSALNANQAQYLELQTAIANALKAGIKDSVQQGKNPGGAFQTAAEQLAKLEQERAANAQRIADNFWLDIQQQINALNGPAGAFLNALIEVDKKFRDNIEAARALGATDDQLRQIEAARDKQEQQLRDAEAERLKQLQNSLDSREAAAKGLTDEAAAIARRAQEEKELFDAQQQGYSDAQIAQLKYIQGLEDAAAAQEKATAIQRQQEDLNVRALRAQGQSAQADALAFQYQQAREMADAIKAGTDPLTLALLANTQQLEAVAFAAQQLQASMQQARSDIQRDVQLGLTTPQGGLAAEQQAFGFGGLTVDQIKALYTPYSGTALTTDQETLNNNIAQFLQDYQALNSANSPAATLSQQASGQGERTAITNAAQTLTSAQGNRMADYLATLVTYEREELEIKRQERAGGSAVPIAPSGNGSTLADIASAATAAATKAVASAVLTTNTGGLSISVTAPIRQTVDLSDPAARRAIVQQVADDLDQLLERRAKDAQLRSGSTLKTGF